MEESGMGWINEVKFDREKGEIYVLGQRHTIVNSYSFRAYRDAIAEIIGHGADAVLYLSGKRHTEMFIKEVLKKSPMARLAKRFKWGRKKITENVVDILTQYGYGVAKLEKLDFEGESIITLKNSCIAANYEKKQEGPVCFYVAGLISGGAEAITGKRYECRETHCIAKGDKECRFLIKPEKYYKI
jgi:predicted hydrocarbon binding protein